MYFPMDLNEFLLENPTHVILPKKVCLFYAILFNLARKAAIQFGRKNAKPA